MQKSTSSVVTWSLGWWTVFFALKLILFWRDTLSFSPLYNFALLMFIAYPIQNLWLKRFRLLVALCFAILLLHYDSYLPPIDRLTSQLDLIAQFDWQYLASIAMSVVSLDAVLLVFTTLVGYLYLHQLLRLSSFVVIGMLIATLNETKILNLNTIETVSTTLAAASSDDPVATSIPTAIDTSDAGLTKYTDNFFTEQVGLVSKLQTLNTIPAPNFDVLLLNVCSLSWRDLELSGQIDHPIFAEFDLLFDNFNSVTSYSGPAILRLLRAGCGQQTHAELFDNSQSNQCSLFDQLSSLGFNKQILMNHTGEFDGFNKLISNNVGPFTNPIDLNTLQPFQRAFDGTKIYDDRDMLSRWQTLPTTQPTVSLYNTISIHDGNRVLGQTGSRLATYKQQQKVLLDNLYDFFQELDAAERNVVVILAPEHGAAMAGDRMQISGMREIPTKAITSTPVGIKFFGQTGFQRTTQHRISEPSSYLAISDLLANILESGLYSGTSTTLESLVKDLPITPRVSQNSGTTVLEIENRQYYSFDDIHWNIYRE